MNQTAEKIKTTTEETEMQSTDLAEYKSRDLAPASTTALVLDAASMDRMMAMADLMAKSVVQVPKHLQDKPSDCLAIIMQAMQWRMNPYVVAQKTHLVNGTLGYEAQLVNAVVQNSGAIKGHFHYEYQGDGANLSCRAGAILRGESHITWNEWLSFSDVQVKNSPLWKTNPKQQLGYLQVKNWARAYCPGAILGVYTPDEIEAFEHREKDITPAKPQTVEDLDDYPQEEFDKNLPKWTQAIRAGKANAEFIAKKVETKGRLTDEQYQTLKDLEEEAAE